MSGGRPLSSRDVQAVLLALWQAKARDVTMDELLHVTLLPPATIHAALDALVARACRIESSPAGIRLLNVGLASWRELIVLLAQRAGWRIGGGGGGDVVVYPEITSTNDAAWRLADLPHADGSVVLADHQTAGRGRLGRHWRANVGQSILLSVVLRHLAPQAMDRLTLRAGLATAEGLEHAVEEAGGTFDGGRLDIKWPNDLLTRGRKLAGVLVETRPLSASGPALDTVVLGIGINVSQGIGDFPPELALHATSLFQASGLMLDRMRVIVSLLASLNRHFHAADGSDAWLDQWRQRCGMLGRHMSFRTGPHTISGRVLDVDPLHGLLLRDDRGTTHFLSARTCSVLP